MGHSNISPKSRLLWIDISRGIAFLMVIYSHIPTCTESIMHFFTPIFLTTFFFVSGYLFKSGQNFSLVFEQRLRMLFVPFIILGTIMIFMSQIITFNDAVDLKSAFVGLLSQNGENEILWFIGALFIIASYFG